MRILDVFLFGILVVALFASIRATRIENNAMNTLATKITELSTHIKQANPKVPSEVANIIAKLILKVSAENEVRPELLVALVETESTFNPMATSSKGARGLTQILVGDTPIDNTKAYDIEYNLGVGIKIFKEKLAIADGDVRKALCLYSGGSKMYAKEVMTCMENYGGADVSK